MEFQAADSILWPMLAQMGWTFALYVWLTVERTRAVARGEVKYATFEFGRGEPANVARIVIGRVGAFDVLAGWVFVAGRVVHTLVQTLTDDVLLRGRVFLINFAAVVVLVGHIILLALEGVGRPLQ